MEESDRLAGIIEFDGGEKWMETAFERRPRIDFREQIFWPSRRFPGLFGSAERSSETGCGLATQGVMSSSARMHGSTPRSECSCITFPPHCSPVLSASPSFLSYFFSRACIYAYTPVLPPLPAAASISHPLLRNLRLRNLISQIYRAGGKTREKGMSKNSLKRLCNYKLYRCLVKEIRGENFSIEKINSSW